MVSIYCNRFLIYGIDHKIDPFPISVLILHCSTNSHINVMGKSFSLDPEHQLFVVLPIPILRRNLISLISFSAHSH